MARLRSVPWVSVLLGLATGVALAVAISAVLSIADLGVHNCRKIERINTRIRTIIVQQDQTLGQPGSPGYSYFVTHPAELNKAHQQGQQSLKAFKAGRC